MERLRRILFLTASIGSAAQADVSINPDASREQKIKDFTNYVSDTRAQLEGRKKRDVNELLTLGKFKTQLRNSGAGGRLGKLLNDPKFEQKLLELYERSKVEGIDVLSLVSDDPDMQQALKDAGLLGDTEFLAKFKLALKNSLIDDGYTFPPDGGMYSPSGALVGGGGGVGAGGSKNSSNGQGPATPSDVPLKERFEEPGAQASAAEGAPTVTQGAPEFVKQITQPDTPASKLKDFGNYAGGGSNLSDSRPDLKTSGVGLNDSGGQGGGNGGNADMTGNQGNQPQGQQVGGNQPTGGTGTNTPSDHGAGGGRSLVSGNTKAPKDTAAQPTQQAAAAPKKPVDPDIALVQKPFYESLLKEYEQSPTAGNKARMDEIRQKIDEYKKAIKGAYPTHQEGMDVCALLQKKYNTPTKLEDLLEQVGKERRNEIEALPMSKITVDELISLKPFRNTAIKDYLKPLNKAETTLSCIKKAGWNCQNLQAACGAPDLVAKRTLCLEIKSLYQLDRSSKIPSAADPLKKCFSKGEPLNLLTKAYQQAQCRAATCDNKDASSDTELAFLLNSENITSRWQSLKGARRVQTGQISSDGECKNMPLANTNKCKGNALYVVDQFRFNDFEVTSDKEHEATSGTPSNTSQKH